MKRSKPSAAKQVRSYIDKLPRRGFVYARDIPGSRRAVETELSRLVKRGSVLRVRNGLYWKGPITKLGMVPPRPAEVASEVAGPSGGPSGISAARHFWLTTQVPSVVTYAVAGRVPDTVVRGVRLVSRPVARRFRKLNETEVALIEVLRDYPLVVEKPLDALVSVTKEALAAGTIRKHLVDEEIREERHTRARERWNTVNRQLLED